jgi:hypothetical protein
VETKGGICIKLCGDVTSKSRVQVLQLLKYNERGQYKVYNSKICPR